MTNPSLAERYLKGQREDDNFGSSQEFDEVWHLVWDKPAEAWPLVLDLVRFAADERELSWVAAGPLEDSIRAHGGQYRNDIVTAARRDVKFGQALRGVWGRPSIDKTLIAELDRIGAAPLR